MIQDEIQDLWPISENYEYTAELGMALRQRLPALWEEWQTLEQRQRYPAIQARSYEFFQFCEKEHKEPLCELLPELLRQSPDHMQREWEAALQLPAEVTLKEETPPRASLSLPLYAPPLCRDYSEHSTNLWKWTDEAIQTEVRESRAATNEYLRRVHDGDYLYGLRLLSERGGGRLTPETPVTNSTWDTLLAASGAVREGALWAWENRSAALAFAVPGSHHAGRSRACGTCMVHHLALAAEELRYQRGINRIALLDLDAHHGNGSEEIFFSRSDVLTVSVHQKQPFFPGTGLEEMRGSGPGRDCNRNIPVDPDDSWIFAIREATNIVQEFDPDFLLVQFGADAHWRDRASDLRALFDDFAEAGRLVAELDKPLLIELGSSTDQISWTGALRSFLQEF